MRASILYLALFLLAPVAALACSPSIQTPSSVPVAGPNCSVRIDLNEVDSVLLGETQVASGGLILQQLSDGNGCYARFNLVVHDCAAAQVMVIGTERFSLMDSLSGAGTPITTGLERIHAAGLSVDGPRDLAGFAALSQAEGYGTPTTLRPNQSLRFGNRTLPLSCACREARRGG